MSTRVVGVKGCCVPPQYHLNAAVPVFSIPLEADTGQRYKP